MQRDASYHTSFCGGGTLAGAKRGITRQIEKYRKRIGRAREKIRTRNTNVSGRTVFERNKRIEKIDRKTGRNAELRRSIDIEATSAGQARSLAPTSTDNASNAGLLGNIKLPRGGWLMDPFSDIKYKGRDDEQNLIKFLKKFESIANYENIDERDQLHYFRKCMRGNANNWLEVNDLETIYEAKEAFKEYFWGDEQQARFRESLYIGRYKNEKEHSMAEYATNLARQAKYLEPPMSDHEIICLKRHFGNEVAREIRPATVKTITDLTLLLEQERKILNDWRRQPRRQITEDTKAKSDTYRNDDQNYRSGKEKTYGNYAREEKTRYSPGETRGRIFDKQRSQKTSVQITEVQDSEEDESNKKIALYKGKSDTNKEGNGKTNENPTKKRMAAAEIKQEMSNNEESGIESQTDSEDDKSTVASIRTREIMQDVEEITLEDQSKQTIQTGPFVTAIFNNLQLKCLIDTRAQVSAMSKETYEKIKQENIRMEIKPIENLQLVGAFSKKATKILFKTKIEFKINNAIFTQEILVVEKLIHEILGWISYFLRTA